MYASTSASHGTDVVGTQLRHQHYMNKNFTLSNIHRFHDYKGNCYVDVQIFATSKCQIAAVLFAVQVRRSFWPSKRRNFLCVNTIFMWSVLPCEGVFPETVLSLMTLHTLFKCTCSQYFCV